LSLFIFIPEKLLNILFKGFEFIIGFEFEFEFGFEFELFVEDTGKGIVNSKTSDEITCGVGVVLIVLVLCGVSLNKIELNPFE
jgi:hypothetical protein